MQCKEIKNKFLNVSSSTPYPSCCREKLPTVYILLLVLLHYPLFRPDFLVWPGACLIAKSCRKDAKICNNHANQSYIDFSHVLLVIYEIFYCTKVLYLAHFCMTQ